MQESLFPVPAPEPLKAPKVKLSGRGKVSYTRYTGATHRCEDCLVVLYEANRAEQTAPPARQATWKRTNSMTLLLCTEHKLLRERDDQQLAS